MIDLALAKDFLRGLDPNAEKFTFQIWDRQSRKGVVLHGTFDDVLPELERYQPHGAGIGVTTNETDGKGRKAENIIRVRAVWCDDDHGFNGKFPVPPSIEVETREGRKHWYWLVRGGMQAKDFQAIMDRMVESYGCDPQCRSIATALRLPGTLGKDGKTVRHTHYNHGYTAEQLIEAFKAAPRAPVAGQLAEPHPDFDAQIPRIEGLLEFIPAKDREEWWPCIAAIHHESGGSQCGFELVDEWSSSRPKYPGTKALLEEWRSLKQDHANPYTLGTIVHIAESYGYREEKQPSKLQTPPTIRINTPFGVVGRPSNHITKIAMQNLRAAFDKNKHYPSDEQYDGLEQIALVIEAMAHRLHENPHTPFVCPELTGGFFVSFMPCGVGKTSVLEACTKAIIADETFDATGIIVFLERCDMIEAMVARANLSPNQFAVMVSEKGEWSHLNKLGVQSDKTTSRVLFTTQAKLENLSKSYSFEKMRDFYFNGKPRQVRVWDEAILPAETLTLPQKQVSGLSHRLQKVSAELSDAVNAFGVALYNIEETLVDVPDFDQFKVSLEDALGAFSDKADKEAVQTLYKLGGKVAKVTRDKGDNIVIQYADILPDDLAPMLILDASGGIRTTYKLWYTHRKGIRFLDSPQKSYEGFTIHHWNRGAGKEAYHPKRGDPENLAEGIALAINQEVPRDKKCLVIHRKPDAFVADMQAEIANHLEGNAERVEFCTWGKHTATNKYSEIEHVFLAGVLQYDTPMNEATGMAAKGAEIGDVLTREEIEEIRISEVCHHLLQAANRGKVRKSVGNGCPKGCHLYVVFSSKNLPRAILDMTFPKADIVEWKPPLPEKLNKREQELADYLLSTKGPVAKAAICRKLGIAKNLDRLLGERLRRYLKQKGYLIDEPNNRTVELVKDWDTRF